MNVIAIAAGSLMAAAMVFAPLEPCAKQQLARATRALTRDIESELPPFVAAAINEALHQMGVPGWISCRSAGSLQNPRDRSPVATRDVFFVETSDSPFNSLASNRHKLVRQHLLSHAQTIFITRVASRSVWFSRRDADATTT
jgi:hypothetical protein